LFGFVICAGLLGYAYYLQFDQFLDPCPLCILQRVAFIGMGVFFLMGGLHAPQSFARYIYAFFVSVFGIFGVVVAARHIWLQNLPPDQIPDCGPGLGYMLETLPLSDTLNKIFTGSGECATVDWSFFGLSMPWWTAIWYVLLIGLALFAARRSRQVSIFRD